MKKERPPGAWSPLPYADWHETCDTLHAHAQLLGKLAVALAPPEPQLQHAALRLTARGIETSPLPLPDRSGTIVGLLDLHAHEVALERSDGRTKRVALRPDRAVADVTAELLAALKRLAGKVRLHLQPQEVPWTVPLDEDTEHHTYDAEQVSRYFAAATGAAQVLAALRAPYRGRSSPVNAWWGSFDIAVSLFSGRDAAVGNAGFIARNSADAEQVEVGWWPGDARYPKAAFFGFAVPAPDGFGRGDLGGDARWDEDLGEYVLDWDAVTRTEDPFGAALAFGRSLVAHACDACGWDPSLAHSASGAVPPVR